MACGILDILTVSRGRRTRALLEGAGEKYVHLVHVGLGWAFARLRLRPSRLIHLGDPILAWLAWDGYGFHQGFFAPRRTVAQRRSEPLLGAAHPVRDQGLGRSLWFHDCADVTRLARRIAGFPPARQGDLWSGVGLAAAYAGGVTDGDLRTLGRLAGPARAHLVQGTAFAAAAHLRADHLPEHTHRAVRIVAGVPAERAAEWAGQALEAISGAGVGSYQMWRSGIRDRWYRSRED